MPTSEVDYLEMGSGPLVILLHSSVAGARQWRSLMDHMSDDYRLVAVNLFGYGRTPAWDNQRDQTLEDQARLLETLFPNDENEVSLVGHSFGGSVAMKAAALFPDRVKRLVLFEPNPFYLLEQSGRLAAYGEAVTLRDCIKEAGATGDWQKAAALFADYWNGEGSWDATPDDRKTKFAEALKPNFHEWDAVMASDLSLSDWSSLLPDETTMINAPDTVRSIKEIVELFADMCPHWKFETLGSGGHMAPLTHPHLVSAIVKSALT